MDLFGQRAVNEQFDRFVLDSTPELRRTGAVLTWSTTEAEDLVQETLVRVARHWNRVRHMDQPRAYARRVLVNLALDGATQRARIGEELESYAEAGEIADEMALRALNAVEDSAQLRWALGQLPRTQRAVLALRYWADLPEAEVASLLGCSAETVKKAAWRGLGRLREILAELVPDRPVSTPAAPEERSH